MPGSDNLSMPRLTTNQSGKETTVNDAIAIMDSALTEVFTADVGSGSVTMTASQFQQMARINIVNASAAGRTVTIVNKKRYFVVVGDAANTQSVDVVLGTTHVTVTPGLCLICFTDGTANGLVSFQIHPSTGVPYDLSFFVSQKPTDNELCMRFVAVRAFTLPSGLTGSFFSAVTASTGNVSFSIERNGSGVGSIAFNASATGVATFSSSVSFAPGDVLGLRAPASADATLANISFALKATR